MVGDCKNHPKVKASHTCKQCKASLCQPCCIVGPLGTFCSLECSQLFAFGARSKGKIKKYSTLPVVIIFFFVFVSIGFFIWVHFAAKDNSKWQSIDLIGQVLTLFKKK